MANAVVDNGYKFITDSRFVTAGDIPSEDDALDAANLDLAEKMSKIARGYDFDFTPKEIDEDGRVRFEDLDVGLYLVLQASQGKGEDKTGLFVKKDLVLIRSFFFTETNIHIP